MKLLFAFITEFLLFLSLNVAGGVFYHPFNVVSTVLPAQQESRSFVWDGILIASAAWVLVLVLSVARKRFAIWGALATAALASALAAGFFLRVGFVTRHW